ncbi:TM2 domain-containing protein [bacterium]|nr:MAG: TM2 domain-containing protein [bacterium]
MGDAVRPRPGKSPLVAVLAALFLYFLPGAGHFYVGETARGVCFLLGTYVWAFGLLYIHLALAPGLPRWLLAPPLLAWWAFTVYDAYRCALASPPEVEDVAQAVSEQAGGGLVPLPSFDAASPALRRTWAFTRWATLASAAVLGLAVLLPSVVSSALALRAGSWGSAAWGLLVAAAAGLFLSWLFGRGRLVYAAAWGAVPLPAEELRREARSFAYSAAGLAALFVFGAFVTQGIWRDLVRRSHDGETKGRLAMLRDAVGRAREAESGLPPGDVGELTPRFIPKIPPAKLSRSAFSSLHPESDRVKVGGAADDAGGWLYDPEAGTVSVNCTHSDGKGEAWNKY